MYEKTILTVMVSVALLALAVPSHADHGYPSEAQYIAGNGLLVGGPDQAEGLPGSHVGGGFHLENPAAPDLPSVSVIDDIHGELSEGAEDVAGPLEYVVSCEEDNAFCNVFVGPGGIMGKVTLE